MRKGQLQPPELLSVAFVCSKLELGERYPSPPQTKSPLFLPVICFLTDMLQKPPQPGEKEQPKDTVLTGVSAEGSRPMPWAPGGIQSCRGAGTDHSVEKGMGNGELGPPLVPQVSHSKGIRCGPLALGYTLTFLRSLS